MKWTTIARRFEHCLYLTVAQLLTITELHNAGHGMDDHLLQPDVLVLDLALLVLPEYRFFSKIAVPLDNGDCPRAPTIPVVLDDFIHAVCGSCWTTGIVP